MFKKCYLLILILFFLSQTAYSLTLKNASNKILQKSFECGVSSELEEDLSVQLLDDKNNPVQNRSINFHIISTPEKAQKASIQNESVLTDANGIAKTKFISGDKAGVYTIAAYAAETGAKPVSFTVECKSPYWYVFIIIGLLGGLALFIYGLSLMGSNLTKLGGAKLSEILSKLTSNKYAGIVVGCVVTTIFQSSSATTVMLVGLINSGVMTLMQSIGVILGANIGATTTPQIVAFKLTDYSLVFITIGFLFMFISKKKSKKLLGEIILGVGLLFYGIKLMSDTMHPMRSYGPFIEYMTKLENPVMGVLVGTLFTAAIQSSGAAIGVFIALAFQGILTFKAALPLTLGANIGTCITAALASIGTNREAKRSALAHILFNISTTIIFLPFLPQFQGFVEQISAGAMNAKTAADIGLYVPRQIANANTISKVIAVVTLIIPAFYRQVSAALSLFSA